MTGKIVSPSEELSDLSDAYLSDSPGLLTPTTPKDILFPASTPALDQIKEFNLKKIFGLRLEAESWLTDSRKNPASTNGSDNFILDGITKVFDDEDNKKYLHNQCSLMYALEEIVSVKSILSTKISQQNGFDTNGVIDSNSESDVSNFEYNSRTFTRPARKRNPLPVVDTNLDESPRSHQDVSDILELAKIQEEKLRQISEPESETSLKLQVEREPKAAESQSSLTFRSDYSNLRPSSSCESLENGYSHHPSRIPSKQSVFKTPISRLPTGSQSSNLPTSTSRLQMPRKIVFDHNSDHPAPNENVKIDNKVNFNPPPGTGLRQPQKMVQPRRGIPKPSTPKSKMRGSQDTWNDGCF